MPSTWSFVRSGENFFRWHVCRKFKTVLTFFFGGKPQVIFGKTDLEIRSVSRRKVQILEVVRIEKIRSAVQSCNVFAPCFHRIGLVETHYGSNAVPHLIDCHFHGSSGNTCFAQPAVGTETIVQRR